MGGWFNSVVRSRLYQPPAGDWLAWTWAELGNIIVGRVRKNTFLLVPNFFGMELAARFFGQNNNIFHSTQQQFKGEPWLGSIFNTCYYAIQYESRRELYSLLSYVRNQTVAIPFMDDIKYVYFSSIQPLIGCLLSNWWLAEPSAQQKLPNLKLAGNQDTRIRYFFQPCLFVAETD